MTVFWHDGRAYWPGCSECGGRLRPKRADYGVCSRCHPRPKDRCECGALKGMRSPLCRRCHLAQRPPSVHSERNVKIVGYATANPCLSMETIGDYHGISRERVRQIIKAQGAHKTSALIARATTQPTCSECGKIMPGTKTAEPRCMECRQRPVELTCWSCDGLFEVSQHILRTQTRKYKSPLRYCPECQHPPCSVCGERVAGRPEAVAQWRNKGRRQIYCLTHMHPDPSESVRRAWVTRRKNKVPA